MARNNKKNRGRRGGVLAILGIAFAASVFLRVGNMDFQFVPPAEASDPDTMGSAAGPASPIRAALDEVTALRDQLRAREMQVDDRERAVEAAQILVEARLAELEAAEIRLQALIETSDQAAEGDLARLTDVYVTMQPEEAAALFAQMNPSFAAGFLSRMPADSSAAIMAELDPAIAYAISVVIATRNAAAPTLEDPPQGVEPETES